MLSEKEVKNIAKLSRIEISSQEMEKIRKDLSLILDYINKLKNIKITKSKQKRDYADLKNILREDIAHKNDSCDFLKNLAPDEKDNYIKIKSVF